MIHNPAGNLVISALLVLAPLGRRHGAARASGAVDRSKDRRDRTFAGSQLLNKQGADDFDGGDEKRLHEFAAALGVIPESRWHMGLRRHSPR